MATPKKATSKYHNYRYDRLYLTHNNKIVRLVKEEEHTGWGRVPVGKALVLSWVEKLDRGAQSSWRNGGFNTLPNGFDYNISDLKQFGNTPLIVREATPDDVAKTLLTQNFINFSYLASQEQRRPAKETVRHAMGVTYADIACKIAEIIKLAGYELPKKGEEYGDTN